MKKRMKLLKFFLVIGFILIVFLKVTNERFIDDVPLLPDPFNKVTGYEPLLREELEKYNLERHTSVLLALMQQESKGKGGDPMQASESAGLPPNTIDDPKESIRQGVKHFNDVLKYGESKKVDFQAIIQSYNMGMGYIDFVEQHGGKHSEDIAKQFSLIQVEKDPDLYNCGGNKDNFRYPYCYGDFTYSTKVTNNLKYFTSAKPVDSDIK